MPAGAGSSSWNGLRPRLGPARPRWLRGAAAEDRRRIVGRALVGEAEIGEGLQRVGEVLAGLDFERVDAAAVHVEHRVAKDVAGGADLALEAEFLAQRARLAVAAAVEGPAAFGLGLDEDERQRD